MSVIKQKGIKDRQFLRYAEVTIKNFDRSIKTVLSDEFEIEFEYFKTLDQTKEDDSGKVTIYGLKDETIELLEEEGGELWLECGYVGSIVDILVVAYISRVSTVRNNNITATTFECSANLMTHFFSGYAISNLETTVPLLGLLKNLGKSLGYAGTQFDTSNVPDASKDKVSLFLNTFITKSYKIGDLKTIVESVCDAYGLTYQRALVDNEDSAVFSFTELGLKRVLKKISTGYPALDVNDPITQNLSNIIFNTQEAQAALRGGVILDASSGLIDSQKEYQLVTSFADQRLNANERETEESKYKRNNIEARSNAKPKSSEQIAVTPNISVAEDNGFVPNSILKGLVIKKHPTIANEATAGGQARKATANFAYVVQRTVGLDLIYFSGFNDWFHRNRGGNHPKGMAFDLTIKSGRGGSEKVCNDIRRVAVKEGYKVKVDNEYTNPSTNATAPHIHVNVYGMIDGAANNISNSPEVEVSEVNDDRDYFGRIPTQINRKYNKITALLNPLVKPQSLVFTKDKKSEDYLIHRVRHATYKGNNKRGDWTMVLYCEDTETESVSPNEFNLEAN